MKSRALNNLTRPLLPKCAESLATQWLVRLDGRQSPHRGSDAVASYCTAMAWGRFGAQAMSSRATAPQ